MLVAMLQGRRVEAQDATRDAGHTCPACDEPVVLRAGRIVTAHFAHRPGSDCTHGEGETPEHLAMKYAARSWMPPDFTVELEVPVVPGRRADVLVTTPRGNRFVIEMQASAIPHEEMYRRTADYRRAGLPVLWVFHLSRLGTVRGTVVRPAKEVLSLARACFGVVHLSDGRDLYVGNLSRNAPDVPVNMTRTRRGMRLVRLTSTRYNGRWQPVPVPAQGSRVPGLMRMMYWDGRRTLVPGRSRYLDVDSAPPVCGGCGTDLGAEQPKDECCTRRLSEGPWGHIIPDRRKNTVRTGCAREPMPSKHHASTPI